MNNESNGRFWLLYPAWIGVCGLAFLLLGNADDPSRPRGRATPDDAKRGALEHLVSIDSERFSGYHVVDAAVYRDQARGEKIWIVLCDTTPRSALREAVVVELDRASGEVIRVRRPAGAEIEEFRIQ